MNTFYVYIIYSKSADVFYKGFTTDPKNRIQSHNDEENEYTRSRGPWKLVYLRAFDDKTNALKEERRLKKQNRPYLPWLIETDPLNLMACHLGSAETGSSPLGFAETMSYIPQIDLGKSPFYTL